jgi:hypothetical protein
MKHKTVTVKLGPGRTVLRLLRREISRKIVGHQTKSDISKVAASGSVARQDTVFKHQQQTTGISRICDHNLYRHGVYILFIKADLEVLGICSVKQRGMANLCIQYNLWITTEVRGD